MLLSLFATLIMISAFLNPSWLIAAPEEITFDNETVTYRPSVGVYAKCSKPLHFDHPICTLLAVKGLATDSHIFPTLWKAAVVFLSIGKFVRFPKMKFFNITLFVLGICIMSITVCMGLLSCCFQSIFKKSIFNISGAAQAAAGS